MPDDTNTDTTPDPDEFESLLLQCVVATGARRDDLIADLGARFPDRVDEIRLRTTISQGIDSGGFGPYTLLEELGRGGQGTVWLAEDRKLGRRVALKVLNTGPASGSITDREIVRFRREAEAASKLDHPNICTLLDAGEVDGVPFLAFRYIDGETLVARIERAQCARRGESGGEPSDAGGDPSSREGIDRIVAIFEKIARALHKAHEKGLIHRDIKPGNIMLTAEDDQPVILDFGLARDEFADGMTITHTGDLLGTPAYMSPEQLMAHRVPLDRRTDIYSLGATLYECLTLQRPFGAVTRAELYQRILHTDPSSCRSVNNQIPSDLQVVVETAMEKDRDHRYQSALDLADDLRRIRRFESIHARPIGVWLRARRWAQRHPLATTTTTLLAVGMIGLGGLFVRARAERDRARINAMIAESTELLRSDPRDALLRALDAVRLAPDADQRPEVLARVQSALAQCRELREFPLPDIGDIQAVRFGPEDRSILLLTWDRTTRRASVFRSDLSDPRSSWTELQAAADTFFPARRDELTASRGARFVSETADLTADGTLVLGRIGGSAKELEHGAQVFTIQVASDGRILTTAADGAIRIWSPGLESPQEFRAGTDRACWHGRPDRALFSLDEKWILSTDMDRNLALLWSPESPGTPVLKIQHGSAITSLAFYPSHSRPRWILTSSWDQTARLTDMTTGVPICEFLGHDGGVRAAAISADGRIVATASSDGLLKLWDVHRDPPAFFAHDGGVHTITWGANGELITAGRDGWVRFWTSEGVPKDPPGFDTRTFKVTRVRETSLGEILTVSDTTSVRLWTRTGHLIHRWQHSSTWIEVSGGDVLTIGAGVCRLTTPREGEERQLLRGGASGRGFFSTDGQRVVVGEGPSPVIMDRSGSILQRLQPGRSYVALHEDRLLAVQSTEAYLCDEKGAVVFRLGSYGGEARAARFSPRGDQAIILRRNGTAQLWSTVTGGLLMELHPGGVVSDAVFSPDGERVYTASLDGWVRCWYVDEAMLLERARQRLDRRAK